MSIYRNPRKSSFWNVSAGNCSNVGENIYMKVIIFYLRVKILEMSWISSYRN